MPNYLKEIFVRSALNLERHKQLVTSNKKINSVLLIAIMTTQTAPAQSANPFTINLDGSITSPCPADFTCSANGISAPGILQRGIVDNTGQKYIQVIVADIDGQSTTTSTESLVRIGGRNGISATQTMEYIEGVDFLIANSEINTGWANTGTLPTIALNQSFSLTYLDVVNTDGSFIYEANYDTAENVIGEYVDVTQRVENSSLLSANPTTGLDIQTAVYRRASGTRVPTAGSIVLPTAQGMMGGGGGGGGGMGGDPMGTGMMGGGTGGTGTWNVDDDVTVFWIGQVCEGCISGGMMGGGGMGGGAGGDVIFSYQLFDNLSDALNPISTLTLQNFDPFDWDPIFGPEPTLQ